MVPLRATHYDPRKGSKMKEATPAPFIVGDVVFLQVNGYDKPHTPHRVIAAEIVSENPQHPSLFNLWADGVTYGPVNVSHRGQKNLRSRAPDWAIDAVDNGPWGAF